jgi:uncharacterized protein
MALPSLINKHRTEILALAKKHGAHNLRVFGSMSRGDYSADSDIDFLVEVRGPTSPWFPAGMIQDLEDLLGRSVDVVTPNALHPLIRDEALNAGIPL